MSNNKLKLVSGSKDVFKRTKDSSTVIKKENLKKNLSFEKWLEGKKNFKRSYWSYAYDGGILVSYYDFGSIPRPQYCNPEPWKN